MTSSVDHGPQRAFSPRSAAELAAWVALFAAARLALALAFADVFAYLEEYEKAAAGKALLDGLGLPWHKLAYHPYEGGGFVISHLIALVFLAVGESVLAVKLTAVAFGAALLAAGWALCWRAGGVACARAFALLYVLAPASVQQNSLLALGIHYQAMLFVALVLLGVLAVLGGARGRATWIATGGCAGAGLYFSYQLGLTLVVALGALVVLARREGIGALKSGLGWAIAGGLVGGAPLVWMAAHVGGAVLDIHGADVLVSRTSKSELLAGFFGSLFAGRGALDATAVVVLWAAPLAGVFALRAGTPSRTLALLVLAHTALFLGAYFGLGFTVGKVVHYFLLHRLAPLWFLGLLATALGFAALWKDGGGRRSAALALLVAPAVVGAADLGRLLAAASPGNWLAHARALATTKGYAYPQYIQKLSPRLALPRVELARVFLRFDEQDPEWLHDALAATVFTDGVAQLEDLEREAAQLGLEHSRPLLAGWGMALRNHWGGDLAARLARLDEQPSERRAALAEAIGRFGNRYFPSVDAVQRELQQGLEAGAPQEFFFGLGMRLWGVRGDAQARHYHAPGPGPWALDAARAHALIDAQRPDVAAALRSGYEHATALARLDGQDSSRR